MMFEEKFDALRVCVKEWKECCAKMAEAEDNYYNYRNFDAFDALRALESDMFEIIRSIFEAVETRPDFVEPEECKDTDRNDPDYQIAVAEHAEELADTMVGENALALRVLAFWWKKEARGYEHSSGAIFDELYGAFFGDED